MVVSLLVISDREPLAWLLSEQRWAIPAGRARSAPAIGDQLLLYTTRGCYRNPSRDRGLVMGLATVRTSPGPLPEAVSFRGRDFTTGFDVDIEGVAPLHHGVELGPMAGHLDFLPDAATWSVRLRRSLIPLSERDASAISSKLMHHVQPRGEVLAGYLRASKTGTERVAGNT
ncbi:hypothetical protein GCM10023168_12000 [Fodinibacter luteus]|uniref:EVE domain-containing protein n=1 Tax=Fodinibacter luteus TaxID=552064 RepID=A0ABP8K816_9MICO